MNKFYLALLSLLPLFSMAQSHYKNGYVINLKGDTLRGYIDYKEWGRNPKIVNFKPALNGKLRRLGINDISYFEIGGAVSYQKYKVNISLNSVDISSAPSLRDTSSTTDTVFLKVLQKGKHIALYGYTDALKNRFYLMENNSGVPYELNYGVYDSPAGSGNVVDITIYRDQLTQMALKYAAAPDKLSNTIQYAKYTEPDLVPIVAQINGDAIPHEAMFSGKNPRYRFFIGAAYEVSRLKYEGETLFSESSPSTTNAPKITAGIDVFANPGVGHLIFRVELAYANHSGYQFKQVPDDFVVTEGSASSQKFSQSTVSLTPQVIYNLYNSEVIKIFVNVGYAVNFSSYNSTITTRDLFGSHTEKETTTGPYATYLRKWGAPQFKAGIVVVKKVEIYGSYYYSTSLTSFTDSALKISSYQFGANYFFK